MSADSYKAKIFISYAHADEPEKPAKDEIKWLSFVTDYLKPAEKGGALEVWTDRLMPGGADWGPDIEQKLRECDIFTLLVSRNSVASDYIIDNEIRIVRERQARGEDVHFYPLLLTPTPMIGLDRVRDKNLRPRNLKPLSSYQTADRLEQMTDAVDEVVGIAKKIAEHKTASARPALPSPARLPSEQSRGLEPQIRDRTSLEQWLARQDREVAVAVAARAALRVAPLAIQATKPPTALSAVFGAAASARAAAKYPGKAIEMQSSASYFSRYIEINEVDTGMIVRGIFCSFVLATLIVGVSNFIFTLFSNDSNSTWIVAIMSLLFVVFCCHVLEFCAQGLRRSPNSGRALCSASGLRYGRWRREGGGRRSRCSIGSRRLGRI